MGEDALVLNVWASTADTGPKPVMVWLHGGGFVHGTGAEGWFQGDRLAARGDVVVVTLNHRLGVLGFLPVSDALDDGAASSVAGMLDIVLALRWVKENIGAFGGDAGNVTIFGQSGGGMKVSALMAMPAARGCSTRRSCRAGLGSAWSNRWTRTGVSLVSSASSTWIRLLNCATSTSPPCYVDRVPP